MRILHRWACRLVVAWMAFAATAIRAQDLQFITKTYDLSRLFAQTRFENPVIPRTDYWDRDISLDEGGYGMDAAGEVRSLGGDERREILAELLKQAVGVSELGARENGKYLNLIWNSGNQAAVSADAETHEWLARYVQWLNESLAPNAPDIRVHVYRARNSLLLDVWEDVAVQFATLLPDGLASGEIERVASLHAASPSAPALLANARQTRYVSDFDAQVAEQARAMDPVMAMLDEGARAALTAAPLWGRPGRLSLTGDIGFSICLEMRRTAVFGGNERIDLPRVGFAVVPVRGEAGNGEETIVFIGADPARPDASLVATVQCALPDSAWNRPAPFELPEGKMAIGIDGGQILRFLGEDESPDLLLDYLLTQLETAGFDPDAVATGWVDDQLVMLTTERGVREIERALEPYRKAGAAGACVQAAWLRAEGPAAVQALSKLGGSMEGARTLADLLRDSPVTARLAFLMADGLRPRSARCGVRRAYIGDFDVVVANQAVLHDPVVDSALEWGLSFGFRDEGETADRGRRVSLDLAVREAGSWTLVEDALLNTVLCRETMTMRDASLQGQFTLPRDGWSCQPIGRHGEGDAEIAWSILLRVAP